MSNQVVVLRHQEGLPAPALIADVGPEATKRFYEFFTVPIRNKNTREAYYRAIGQFLDFFAKKGFRSIEDLEPIHVAAYIEWLSIRSNPEPLSAASIKQHMAGIRMFLSWLTEKGVLAINPAREVKTPKFSRTEGKTPAFSVEEVHQFLDSVDTSHVIGHRDKAFLATLAYTFARVGAVVSLKVEDYFQAGKRSLIRFHEKGGKEKEIPVHHKLEEILDEYLKASHLKNQPQAPLFPITLGKTRLIGNRPMTRIDGAIF
jgi:site-specific recombinase XerD